MTEPSKEPPAKTPSDQTAGPEDSLAPSADMPPPPPHTAAVSKRAYGSAVLMGSVLGAALVFGAGYATLPLWAPTSSGPEVADLNARLAALEAQSRPGDGAPADDGDVADLESQRAELSQELNAVIDRMGKLEEEIAAVARLVNATTPPSNAVDAVDSLRDLSARLAKVEEGGRDAVRALGERVAGLEKSEGGQELGELRNRSDRLTSALSALAEKVGSLEGRRARDVQSNERRGVIAAIDRLREILPRSAPFAADLAALNLAARGNPDVLAIVGDLEPYAGKGAPTFATIQGSFDAAGLKILQAVSVKAGEGFLERAWGRLAALVTIRKTGPVTGDGPEARVARAEAALKDGDLMDAVAVLEGLTDPAAVDAATPWLNDARARLAVERALAQLHVQAVALLNSGGE